MTVSQGVGTVKPCPEVKYPQKMTETDMAVSVEHPAIFDNVDQAVDAAVGAQKIWAHSSMALRKKVVSAIREAGVSAAKELAWAAWSETGRGRYEDKIEKNILCATNSPGVEDLASRCFSGDNGVTISERAPLGVVGSITPVTNPTSTIINNSIIILAGGNGVVYNPHPSAKRSTCRAVAIIHDAIVRAGGPPQLITAVSEPTVEGATDLMKHPKTAVSLVTGGPAVVKIALSSGKRAICAGPGNPPVVVDETADLTQAAKGIVKGASFDNNMVCIDEKTCIAVKSVADKLLRELSEQSTYRATPEDLAKLEKVIFLEPPTHGGKPAPINTKLVGHNAMDILREAGITPHKADVRLIVVEVPRDHSLVWTEQLMPILPFVRVEDVDEAIKLAKASEKGYRHTCAMYSRNVQNTTRMGKEMDTTIFVKNGPCLGGDGCGGEGYTAFSIAGTTGEGMTSPTTFTRERRFTVVDALRIV